MYVHLLRENSSPSAYRTRHIGKRFVTEYAGSGLVGVLAHDTHHFVVKRRRDAPRPHLEARATLEAVDSALHRLTQQVGLAMRLRLYAEGYHEHHAQWRRSNGVRLAQR